jgi:hypothetical protein
MTLEINHHAYRLLASRIQHESEQALCEVTRVVSVHLARPAKGFKVPIHVQIWLGSGSNETDSFVCGAPREWLGRVRLGSLGLSVGARLAAGSLLARTRVGGPKPVSCIHTAIRTV